jgi:large conductance mechanosensitive channel
MPTKSETTSKAATAKTKAAAAAAKARAAKLKDHATGHGNGFMTFVREQGVVGLAVGLAIGTEAGVLIKQLVGSTITPIIDLLIGKGGLEGFKFTVHVGDRTGVFALGMLIDVLIRFMAVAFVVYMVVHLLRLDRLDKKKEA